MSCLLPHHTDFRRCARQWPLVAPAARAASAAAAAAVWLPVALRMWGVPSFTPAWRLHTRACAFSICRRAVPTLLPLAHAVLSQLSHVCLYIITLALCRALSQKAERLQAVYDKFRAVVAPGDSVSLTWHTALPAHRAAFENFFVGWKPLPPSMAGALGKHGSCGRRSNCGGGGGGSAALEATAPVATRRSTRTGARRSLAAALSEGETGEDDDGMGSPVKAADAPPHVEAAGGPVTTNAVQAAAPAAQPLQALHAQAQLPHVAAGTNMPFIDPSFSLWAMSRGLGAAVPPPSALPNAEQLQHAAAALGLQPQLQAQLLAQMAASTQLHNPGMHLSRADQSFARAALPQMQSQAMAQPMPAQPAAPQAPAQLPAGQISSETLLQYLQVPSLAAGLLAMQQAGSVKAGFEHFNARQGSNDSARSSGDCLRSPLPPTLPLQTNSTGGSAPTFPQLLADPAFALPGSAAQPPAGSAWSLFQK